MAQWAKLPLDEAMFTNIDEALLSEANAAIENGYVNEAGGESRFPGRIPFVELPGQRFFLNEWRGTLIAVNDEGKVWKIEPDGTTLDVTNVPLSGDGRPIFAQTEDELCIAAGGRILKLDDAGTAVLSPDAPETTHVAFVDGYLVAPEPFSGRWFHSRPGQYTVWQPLDVFTAEAKPDDINAIIVTPYRELLVCGVDSIEQWERLAGNTTTPFSRRWSTGEGLGFPYTIKAIQNGTYGINREREFVRFSGQVSDPESNDVQLTLEQIDNWDDAWVEEIRIKGQKFLVIQAPHAVNAYGTDGITLLFDYRNRRWSFLYDFDEENGLPIRWAPWSYYFIYGRHFVGVPGGIEEMKVGVHNTCGCSQRFLLRTAHIDRFGPSRVDGLRLRLKRGTQDSNTAREGELRLRCRVDNRKWSRTLTKRLGRYGERDMVVEWGHSFGTAFGTWQFEIEVTDDVPVEIVGAQIYVERLRG